MSDSDTTRYKWMPAYRCLSCGRCSRHSEEVEMTEHQAGVLAAALGNHSIIDERARKNVPQTIYHDCFGDGHQFGTAIFAGFVKVKSGFVKVNGKDLKGE